MHAFGVFVPLIFYIQTASASNEDVTHIVQKENGMTTFTCNLPPDDDWHVCKFEHHNSALETCSVFNEDYERYQNCGGWGNVLIASDETVRLVIYQVQNDQNGTWSCTFTGEKEKRGQQIHEDNLTTSDTTIATTTTASMEKFTKHFSLSILNAPTSIESNPDSTYNYVYEEFIHITVTMRNVSPKPKVFWTIEDQSIDTVFYTETSIDYTSQWLTVVEKVHFKGEKEFDGKSLKFTVTLDVVDEYGNSTEAYAVDKKIKLICNNCPTTTIEGTTSATTITNTADTSLSSVSAATKTTNATMGTTPTSSTVTTTTPSISSTSNSTSTTPSTTTSTTSSATVITTLTTTATTTTSISTTTTARSKPTTKTTTTTKSSTTTITTTFTTTITTTSTTTTTTTTSTTTTAATITTTTTTTTSSTSTTTTSLTTTSTSAYLINNSTTSAAPTTTTLTETTLPKTDTSTLKPSTSVTETPTTPTSEMLKPVVECNFNLTDMSGPLQYPIPGKICDPHLPPSWTIHINCNGNCINIINIIIDSISQNLSLSLTTSSGNGNQIIDDSVELSFKESEVKIEMENWPEDQNHMFEGEYYFSE